MAGRAIPEPTEGELAILNILWQNGPSTVRQVHAALPGRDCTRYTTTLKQLQVMTEKRLVKRNATQKSHVYSVAIKESDTKRTLIARVIDSVFGGSVRKLVLHALESRDIDDEQLSDIKRLLAKWEKTK